MLRRIGIVDAVFVCASHVFVRSFFRFSYSNYEFRSTPTLMAAILSVLTAIALLVWLYRPSMLKSDYWRAVSTPLASIIGSGFLVSVPILRELVGAWAVFAMAALTLLSYFIGAAIRENIIHVEPLLGNGDAGTHIASAERLSEIVLAFSYFVSVAYYLVLFATFLLKPFALHEVLLVKFVVTVILAGIGLTGLLRGFHAVEGLEIYAVSAKLAIIAGMMAGLAVFSVFVISGAAEASPIPQGHIEFKNLPALLGLLIMVQGFETSRFLGSAYSPELRVRTMKAAQWLSTAVYVLFFLLMIPLMGTDTKGEGVVAIVDMLQPVSYVLPIMVMIGALASQSSAAIADALGAGGLLHSLSGKRIRIRHTYPLIAIIAALVTWETNVYSLITLASRCFALYYFLQCVVAFMSAFGRGKRMHAVGFAILAVLCAAVVIFGSPVEGG